MGELSRLLVGKTVTAVSLASPEAGVCAISTSDSKSFRVRANDLGEWLEDDRRSDGLYPSIRSTAFAPGSADCSLTSRSDDLSVAKDGEALSVVLLGDSRRVSSSSVSDPGRRRSSPTLAPPFFLGKVLASGDMWSL